MAFKVDYGSSRVIAKSIIAGASENMFAVSTGISASGTAREGDGEKILLDLATTFLATCLVDKSIKF